MYYKRLASKAPVKDAEFNSLIRATNPKDKVFALYGLLGSEEVNSPYCFLNTPGMRLESILMWLFKS